MKKRYFKRIVSFLVALLLFAEPVISYADTDSTQQTAVSHAEGASYSDRWVEDEAGWHVKGNNGGFIQGTWVNDLSGGGTESNWYLIDESGRMVDNPFIETSEGHLYALSMEHDGHYGRMIQEDFVLDGRKITVNKVHDGTFGRILLSEDIAYIAGKYTILRVNISSKRVVTLAGKRSSTYTGGYSGSVTEKKEDEPDEPGNLPDPSMEMGFEEASQEMTIFVRALNGKGSISQIKNLLKITDISMLDGGTKDYTAIPFNILEWDDGIYMVWPNYQDGFGDWLHIYEPGHTYMAEIPEDCDYILGATAYPEEDYEIIWATEGIKRINFNVFAKESFDAKLDPSLMFIPFNESMNMTGEAFGAVVDTYINEDGTISSQTAESVTGTFRYMSGALEVGDTVAIYKGDRPFQGEDDSIFATDETDQLAYLTITEANGSEYTYRTAELEEVLFIPDLLLVEKREIVGGDVPDASSSDYGTASSSDYEGPEEDELYSGFIKVKKNLLSENDFGEGDFIAIYDKDGTEEDVIYGLITKEPQVTGSFADISYEVIDYDELKEMYSMHYSVPVDVDLTDAEAEKKEKEIEDALLANNGEMLTELMNAGITEYITSEEFANLTGEPAEETALLGADTSSRVQIKEYPVPSVSIQKDKPLKAFDGKYNGLITSIKLVFEVVIDKKYDIWLELEYEQQYGIDYNIDGEVTCEKLFLGIPNPATLDANVTISIDTHSAYHFRLQLRGGLVGYSNFDEDKLSKEEKAFIKEFDRAQSVLTELAKPFGLEYVKDCITGNLGNADSMALSQMARAYAAFMGRSNIKDWYMLPSIELFQVSRRVLYQTVHIRLRGDICCQLKMNALLFIEYNSKTAERMTYTVTVRKQLSKAKDVIQLMPPEATTGVYVFGHAGFRIGVKVTAEIGLIHVKVAKLGITGEAGLYAELLGVFSYYYHEKGNESEHVAFGFMNFETGLYAIVTVMAQALNMRQLTVSKTLVDKKWPFFTLGIETLCFEFDKAGQELEPIKIKAGEDTDIPAEYLKVKELTLNTGLISVKDPTQTGECGKIDVEGVKPSPIWSGYGYPDRVSLSAFRRTPGKGEIVLSYDNGYDFLDGVIGTIPPFSMTIPVEIVE